LIEKRFVFVNTHALARWYGAKYLLNSINEIRKENRSGDKSPERVLKTAIAASLTNAGAQETPVVMQTHLAAGEKIRHRCDRLSVAVRAGTDHQDQITQGKPCASLQNLPISFHFVPVFSMSSSGAIPNCEYLIH